MQSSYKAVVIAIAKRAPHTYLLGGQDIGALNVPVNNTLIMEVC